MASKRKVRNLLALAVMSYLTHRPMHPYELSRTLRTNGDDRSIKFNHGSLYMVVGQLERAGFVAAQETSREGQRPERTVYALTDDGRREHAEWMRELVSEPQHEYPGFVAALSLIGALAPADVVELLQTRLARLQGQRAEIRALVDETVGNGVHPLFLVEEEYRIAQIDGEIGFVGDFLERIADPNADWRRTWDAMRAQTGEDPSQ
ncbi:MAG: PadR family transcriptional regulator [Actinomycetia bacterium]|nr:PadR family transcriptional regulator [Actinomycetes bacterium]